MCCIVVVCKQGDNLETGKSSLCANRIIWNSRERIIILIYSASRNGMQFTVFRGKFLLCPNDCPAHKMKNPLSFVWHGCSGRYGGMRLGPLGVVRAD